METAEPHLFATLESRIQRRTGWRVRDLAIEFQAERTILRGRASSAVSRQLAEHIVCDSCPDLPIENVIEIENPVEILPGVPFS